jgi:outer membrane protein insertion porin family
MMAGRARRSAPLRNALTFVMALALASILRCEARAAQDAADDAQTAVVERVEVARSQFIQKETLLFYISTRAGDRYDQLRLREDFRRLWETGFLDDLSIDVRDTASGGKVVTFVVTERKRIQIVDYRGSKALTSSAIEDALKEKDAALKLDTFYDVGKARRVEGVLRDMLAEKGRPFATVKHEAKVVGASGLQVSFVIEDGPKARVEQIDFIGNGVFSDRTLRRRMKQVKQRGFWSFRWLLGKTTYTPEKWSGPEGDQKRLEDFYLDRGYVTASVGEPKVTYLAARGGRKPTRGIRLEIPVSEGEQYRVGEVKFEGMTVFKPELVLPVFKLVPGEVYRESKLKKGFDKLRDAYGGQGYFQWTGRPERKPDPDRKVVDVVLAVEEDRKYYVGRITFTGNTSTRDKVIRREVYLNEGDVFNTEALKLSIRRINQLGYFKPMEGVPDLSPSLLGDDRIDVTFKVEEQNRSQFTFGGGVSGLEGTFVNASFSTSNFLGLGETFQVSAQTGARSNNYQIAVTEPYLFDRPITAGIDLYSRKLDYLTAVDVVGYSEVRTGASATVGLPLGRFTRLFSTYTYEVIDTAIAESLRATADSSTGVTSGFSSQTTEPTFGPFYDEGRRPESRLSPSIVYNTVDNPYTPRRGMRLTGSMTFAGGPLGGTVNYLRPDVEAVLYVPHLARTALGMRAQTAWIRPFAGTAELPYYQRFFLGGETQIRGVNIRTVGPVDDSNRATGGNKFVLFNAEYYFDVGGPLRFLLFYDAGQAFAEGKNLNLRQLRTSTGAELRFVMPVLNVPFRLIYAFNLSRDAFQPPRTFKFAVGTTF